MSISPTVITMKTSTRNLEGIVGVMLVAVLNTTDIVDSVFSSNYYAVVLQEVLIVMHWILDSAWLYSSQGMTAQWSFLMSKAIVRIAHMLYDSALWSTSLLMHMYHGDQRRNTSEFMSVTWNIHCLALSGLLSEYCEGYVLLLYQWDEAKFQLVHSCHLVEIHIVYYCSSTSHYCF
jgi:hypothetical protein